LNFHRSSDLFLFGRLPKLDKLILLKPSNLNVLGHDEEMKIWLMGALIAASIFSTISCTSLSTKSDRDPASIAEACSDQTASIDPAKLKSQVFFQLQELERAASKDELPQIYEEQFNRLQQMVTKSRLYSVGLTESIDPRLAVVNKARALSPSAEWDERFFTLSPADRVNPRDEQIQRKAGDMIRLGRTAEARRLLRALSNKKSASVELRMSARLDLLKSYRYQGSDDEFLKRLERDKSWYAKTFDHTPGAAKQDSNFQQALIRSHIKKENFDLAFKELGELKAFLIKENQSSAGADWLAGRLYTLLGQLEKARDSYELALKALPSDDVTKDQVTWRLGWMNYKLKNYARAIELWAELPTDAGSAQVLARNMYWTARATTAVQGDSGKALFRRLAVTFPGTFYAPLSLKELGEQIQPLSFTANECEVAGRIVARMKRKYPAEDAQAFAQLYRQRDLPRAKLFLMDLSISRGLDSSLLLAAAALGDYQPLIIGFSRLTLAEQNEIFSEFPQLLYPNPYPEQIVQAATANNLDPYFPLSTIRQESVFAPRARSFADARGLMQVMPQLGPKYAALTGLQNYSTEKLFEPSTNIPIGTRHLKEGFEQNGESRILTLAAYNAGDEIARVWAKRLSKDPLEFVEEIPFSETNGYVKAILRNEIYNRALYGGEAFSYPQELLKR
jgi:soluble lytic murein transglycosylase